MNTQKIYAHYGHKKFNPDYFKPITNIPMCNKPDGGLWASPNNSGRSWLNWLEENGYLIDPTEFFLFTLSDSAKVYHIYTRADVEALPRQQLPEPYHSILKDSIFPDFEALLNSGYDAIEFHLSEEPKADKGIGFGLYFSLYGWDCDSLLVLNPQKIILL